jgi:hypothetical protein
MLENLQTGMVGQPSQQGQQAMQLLEDLQALTRAQQELLDQTFRQAQDGQSLPGQQMPGQPMPGMPMPGPQSPGAEPGMPADSADGAATQEALRRALGELMRQIGEMAGDIPMPLGRAEQEMRQAGQALEQGLPGEATDPQGRAVDELQQGLQSFVDQLMEQAAQQAGQPGMLPMPMQQGRDPLGRPLHNSGSIDTNDVQIPDQGEIQRARQILDELRRRLGERHRPAIELEYIERLLRRF